ncbi:MAG: nucleic acid-binding protein [Thermomicrobiales bacterium]
MTRTYVDAGVLIAAATARAPAIYQAALAILDDRDRQYVCSSFIQLEVTPKASCHRQTREVDFYEDFFESVIAWADRLDLVVENALEEASRSGLAALDALYVAAAKLLGAEELVTTERPGKPIHRVTGIKVVSIHPSAVRTA